MNDKPILVLGRGLMGSKLAALSGEVTTTIPTAKPGPFPKEFVAVSHLRAEKHIRSGRYCAVVNAAGLRGRGKCKDWGATIKANVGYPLHVLNLCREMRIPLVQPSTAGVYDHDQSRFVNENARLFPHNFYTASKMLMEHTLAQEAYIDARDNPARLLMLRMGFLVGGKPHDEDFVKAASGWSEVTKTWGTFTHIRSFAQHCVNWSAQWYNGAIVQNIGDAVCWMPDFAPQADPIKPKNLGEMTPLPALDCSRANLLLNHKSYEVDQPHKAPHRVGELDLS